MCSCKSWCVLCLLIFSILLHTVYPFNVDSFNYALYEAPFRDGHNSMFGFSVALHKERNNGWLIVGAPEAQSNQPGVIHGGAVYKCPTVGDGRCEEIPFDTKGHNLDTRNNLMDNKTEQWFGATVSSSGREEGPIVACAPRYTWFPNGKTRRDPVGTCYVCNGFFADFNEYSPCRTYQWGYHRQGSCQAGFSAAINKVGDRLFIGSPGSWYWQGQMYSVDAHATFDFKPSLFSATYGHEGQVHQQSLETRPAVFSTTEGTEKDDDSYMGYSTITGDFLGNGEEGIAVGMPRGNDLRGKVLLFTWNLTNFLHHFTSDQIGSYYGYALAAADVDGDEKLDLIIGAPMYTVQNNKDTYDVGRVYVIYHQSEKGKFVASDILDGFNSKSRFGQALASLGDINQDGYGDFAVGAPYDGKDNRGAVYIYHGSSKGIRKKFSQVIFAEDVIPSPTGALTTFGFSITGGLDLDGNQYPDMAVGAYLSNKAFFFRSRPVIKVEASVKFLDRSVNIADTDYVLKSDHNTTATRTKIQFCSKYYGKGIPSSLNLGVEYILDTKKLINPRMGFVDDEGQNRKNSTITLLRDEQVKCSPPVDVYVRSDIRDKLTALVVEAKYWLKDDQDLTPSYLQQLPRNPRATLFPVLDLNTPPSKKDSITIHKNCGDDNVCIPNLDLVAEPSVREYYLDSEKKFFLDITVSNSGEDAFESTVDVKYPDGFFYITSTDVQALSHVLCSSGENNTIRCDIGNPVPHNTIVHFKLSFQPDYAKELPSKLYFDVAVNSTNEEPIELRWNNKRKVEISILYDVIQEIRGRSIPTEILFSPASSLYAEDISNQTVFTAAKDRLSEEVIGPQVIHVYELKNVGRTTIKATEIFFVWPATTSTGEDFLYLVDPPHFSFSENLNLKCGHIPANYRDFELSTRRKSIWELYDINVDSSSEKTTAARIDGSQKIGSTVGGGIVKIDEKLDKAVDTSGDSSKVMDVRHQNKTESHSWRESQRVQIYQSESGNLQQADSRAVQVGGKNYYYRCFQTINGREVQVECDSDLDIQRNLRGLLQLDSAQHQQEGNVQFWCLEPNEEGTWRRIPCGGIPKVPVVSNIEQQQDETIVQFFKTDSKISNRLESGAFQRENDFVYRCFRRRNNQVEETECGKKFLFNSVDLPWVLEQSGIKQDGDIRYACLKPDSVGRLQRTNCLNIPKVRVKTTIFRTYQGENNTHFWNSSDVYSKRRFSKVQVFRGDENLRRDLDGGIYRHQIINGYDFIYRCFENVNGFEQEVDCGRDFSIAATRLDINNLLQSSGIDQNERIRYTCLEDDGRGNLRSSTCGALPPIRIKTQVITSFWKSNGTHYWNKTGVFTLPQSYSFEILQVLLGGEETVSQLVGNYRLETVENHNFLFRCFGRNLQQTDCGPNFSLTGINIIVLMRRAGILSDGNIRYFCLQLDEYGSWVGSDCGRLPRFQRVVEQKKTFETVRHEILRRCLRLENGQWKDVDCRSNARFQAGGGSSSTFVEQCFQTVNGRRETIDCNQVPAGATFTDVFSQISQGQGRVTQDYNYHGSYSNEEEYEDEYDNAEKGESGYVESTSYHQQQGRRDPHTYGSYGASRNKEVFNSAGFGRTSGDGRGLTTGVLDLGSLNPQSNVNYHNNVGDNVPTSAPLPKNWHHGRRKRQIVGDNHPSIASIKEKYPCENLGCVYMRCTIENLQHKKPLTIALRGRLNAKVLRNMKLDNEMQFSSMMLARVHKVPHLMSIQDGKMEVQEVETVVKVPEEIKSETVPLWVVVLSAVAGTIILLLLIFLLYKLGFFKRNRPSSAPERQPLNRNGYHHGDEAL